MADLRGYQMLPPKPLTPEQRRRMFDSFENAMAAIRIVAERGRRWRPYGWRCG